MSNSLGKLFTVTSFGESHGQCIGAVVDGCPAGLALTETAIQIDLDRRKPGSGIGTTTRKEEDKVEIFSGIFNGITTGAPICLIIQNRDADSSEYEKTRFLPRPGQADYTAFIKYGGLNDFRGGGRFSGRITATLVMGGAIAVHLVAYALVKRRASPFVEAALPVYDFFGRPRRLGLLNHRQGHSIPANVFERSVEWLRASMP